MNTEEHKRIIITLLEKIEEEHLLQVIYTTVKVCWELEQKGK